MRVMLMNGSPKKMFSTSGYIQKIMKPMLGRVDIISCPMHTKADIPNALEQLKDIDALVIASPLYVDGIAANMLGFLAEAEKVCKEKDYHFKVYSITNSGFIEGHQNEINLRQYECWAERAGLTWGGGLGVGGIWMLLWYPIIAAFVIIIKFVIDIIQNILAGSALVSTSMLLIIGVSILLFLFLNVSLFIGEAMIAHRVKKGHVGKNLYGRFMCPTIIYLIIANIFMLVIPLIAGGIFKSPFRKDPA